MKTETKRKNNPAARFARNRKLIHQLGVFFFIFLGLASLANMYMVYNSGMDMLLKEKAEGYRNMADYAAKNMEESAAFHWLLSYWEENADEMDIIYDDDTARKERWEEFDHHNPGLDIHLLTVSDVEKLSVDDQKLYAEAEYMEWTDQLNRLKRIYRPDFISCYYPRKDTEMYYFLSAAEEGQERGTKTGQVYPLGTVKESDLETHPVRTATWSEGKMQAGLDTSGSGYYHAYAPVLFEGKPVCLIDVTINMHTVQGELLKRIWKMELLSVLSFLVSAVFLVIVIRGFIIRPVSELQSAIHDYQEDKVPEKVDGRLQRYFGLNEIGRLSEDFTALAYEVQDYIQTVGILAGERQRIAGELELATRIQFSMLPREFPADPRFDMAAYMLPAKEVGGDLYDFFYVDDTHMALVIGDVSGKGVPAAIFMAVAKMLIKNTTLSGHSPGEILKMVNNQLCQENEAEMFISVWLGILDLETGKMICGNAGHEYPAVCKAAGSFELLRDKHGMVLGGMENMQYKEYEMILEAGDRLFVYTDGVPEATDASEQLYGTDRMLLALENKDLNAKELLAAVKADIDAFVGDAPQFDDITMLTFWYHGVVSHS